MALGKSLNFSDVQVFLLETDTKMPTCWIDACEIQASRGQQGSEYSGRWPASGIMPFLSGAPAPQLQGHKETTDERKPSPTAFCPGAAGAETGLLLREPLGQRSFTLEKQDSFSAASSPDQT